MKIAPKIDDNFHQLSRYGHAAVVAYDTDDKNQKMLKMFVFGGFSGVARHDVIKLSLACKQNKG
jgi:hypothetical protein